VWSRTGAATAFSPSSSSSTENAYPSRAAASTCALSSRCDVIVWVVFGCHVREQDLAARGGVQRRQLTDPVVRGDRTRPARLVDVDDEMRPPHGDVDGFAELRGELFAACTGLLGDVQLAGHGAGQPQDAEAEAVLSAVLGLLDEFAFLERREQPERRRLVHADVGGDLADAGFTTLGQDLQHADGAVDRLHAHGSVTSRVAHNATIRAGVAH
jgi:hypothetical protein